MPTKLEAKVTSNASKMTEVNRLAQNPRRSRAPTERLERSKLVRIDDAILTARQDGMIADEVSGRRSRSWLMRMATGNLKDQRTNLFIIGKNKDGRVHKSYDVIKEEFNSIYSEAMRSVDPNLASLIETVLESGNRDKMGSKSMYKGYFEDGPAKVQAVYSDKAVPSALHMPSLKRAIDRYVAFIPSQSIRLKSVTETAQHTRDISDEHDVDGKGLDPTTNSGPPFYLSGWRPNPLMAPKRLAYATRVFDWILRRAKAQYEALSQGRMVEFHAMLGQRIVNRGPNPLDDVKTKRLIIAMEKSEAILWKTFTYDTQEALKKIKFNGVHVHNAWYDTPFIDMQQQVLLEHAHSRGLKVLSGDISAFDASVVPRIWELTAAGMSDWYYRASKFFTALNLSVINNVRLLTPGGVWKPQPSSIKSGSGGTNFMDCALNIVSQFYGEEMGFYKIDCLEVQGDDFGTVGSGVEPESISEAFSHCGFTVHPVKQEYREDIVMYLQRCHVRGKFGGIASVNRVLNSILVQERNRFDSEIWNPYMEAIQAIAKMDNAAFAPAFEGLVTYVRDNDKYRLGADLTVQEVIDKAGVGASELLSMGTDSFSTKVMGKSSGGFAKSPSNGVLRGKHLPAHNGKELLLEVYTEDRIAKASSVA